MSVGSFYKQSASGGLITLQPAAADIRAFESFAAACPKAAAVAQRRAINKTIGWLRTHIARTVSKEQRIAQRAVRQRLRSYLAKGSAVSGKLWFGLNPIEASRIGRPRETKNGVSVAGRRYVGAFYKRVHGGNPDIWIRTASKHFRAADYPDSDLTSPLHRGGQRRGSMDADQYGRFPVAKAKVNLDTVRPAFDQWTRRAHQRLLEILRQELNYELHKYLRKSPRA
ncbi:hypothetical protein ACIPK7_06300 [Pseudomonas sp. NPDC086581]|uniref:hypothetical protein n=1 Tax=Pseudomonas sp. NPDC086581 TaxID=3364432 RepID=UPI0038161144